MAVRMRVTSCITNEHNRSGNWQQSRTNSQTAWASLNAPRHLINGGVCFRECSRPPKSWNKFPISIGLFQTSRIRLKIASFHPTLAFTILFARSLTNHLRCCHLWKRRHYGDIKRMRLRGTLIS